MSVNRIQSTFISVARVINTWVQAVLLLPVVLFVVLIRPFILIRFGVIDSSRIGHFCNIEGYLCSRDTGNRKRRVFDIIGCSKSVCNYQLKVMYERVMCILPVQNLLYRIIRACKLWTRTDIHYIKFNAKYLQYLDISKPHIGFTKQENRRGEELLERIGIPYDKKWVCLHNRDSAYLNTSYNGHDWSYHNFRDFSVQTFRLAAEELTARGYYVLRMGASTEQPFISDNKKIIDYANHPERSDFADMFLLGNCHFYLGSDSGIFAVSAIFRRPFAFVNFPVPQPCYEIYHWNPVPLILKRARNINNSKMLSLQDMFESGLANSSISQDFTTAGVELVCNTPMEIRDLAIEVDDRIMGKWHASQEDKDLQKEFWAICRQYSSHNNTDEIKARIGTTFLRKHRDLLE